MSSASQSRVWWLIALFPAFASTAIMSDDVQQASLTTYVTAARAGVVIISTILLAWLVHEVLAMKTAIADMNEGTGNKST